MSGATDIIAARARRRNDAGDTTPRELVAMVADDLDKGNIAADEMLVVAVKHLPNDKQELHWYLGGADRYKALALLALLTHCISEESFG